MESFVLSFPPHTSYTRDHQHLTLAHRRCHGVFLLLSASVAMRCFPWHEQAWRASQDALCKADASDHCLKWSEGRPAC